MSDVTMPGTGGIRNNGAGLADLADGESVRLVGHARDDDARQASRTGDAAVHEQGVSGGFGPSALATPANAISAGRILAAPVFVSLIMTEGASWVTVAVGVAVAGTDGIDGWLARRQGTTTSGAFLDPLADKVLVLGSFFALAAQGTLPWLPVGLMTIREVSMSAYRSWVGRRGVSVPARRSAKLKTLVQELAIATCLVPPLARHRKLQRAAVWSATALTLVSGAQYFIDGRRAAGRWAAGRHG